MTRWRSSSQSVHRRPGTAGPVVWEESSTTSSHFPHQSQPRVVGQPDFSSPVSGKTNRRGGYFRQIPNRVIRNVPSDWSSSIFCDSNQRHSLQFIKILSEKMDKNLLAHARTHVPYLGLKCAGRNFPSGVNRFSLSSGKPWKPVDDIDYWKINV